ncbi:DUF6508 domain-containing protein [Nostoc sp. CMAA1605]|uniref:DUF6508 domain-containing protein n=1 Tax=Nostoc sp. CMAA1605 TaxID=2055159 RepID=UPI001F264E7D|nr:DUF6508 domain-containing protein [Nostoc sp. CMAA1605]
MSFDWIKWRDEAERLNVADIYTIQKLLTSHVHQERFCSGHLADMLDHNHFVTMLHRLQVIRLYVTSD